MEGKDGRSKHDELALEFEKLNARKAAIENEKIALQEMREVM